MKKLKKNDGVTMIYALIVSLIAAIACTGMFTVVSAMIKGAGKEKALQQARILASSVSEVVLDEFAHVQVIAKGNEEDPENPEIVYQFPLDYDIEFDHSIPGFVYSNLGKGSWGWYNEEEDFHSKEEMSQIIQFDPIFSREKRVGKVSVIMYWESDSMSELNKEYGNRELYVTVRAEVEKQQCEMTYQFDYSDDSLVKGGYLWRTPELVS